jgi:hypothetical protein
MVLFLWAGVSFAAAGPILSNELSANSKQCIRCHQGNTPGIYGQWMNSMHFTVKVGCYECHQANKSDADAFEHNGSIISVIVSPKDCSKCHPEIVKQFSQSPHATTAVLHMGSQVAELMQAVVSANGFYSPAFPSQHALTAGVTGCFQCHGSHLKSKKTSAGKVIFDAATWPNEGIGRVNPDKSNGSCSACHGRHEFSISSARQPETCGKCHSQGSGVPMFDIYKSSAHGRNYYTNKEKMNLDSREWLIGKQYVTGPTCASCHLSGTMDMPVTHNAALRFNWGELGERAKKSRYTPPPEKCGCGFPPGTKIPEDYNKPRTVEKGQTMKKVCQNCHGSNFIDGYYIQYMGEKRLVYEKYHIPGTRLYNMAKEVLNAMKDGKFAFFTHPLDFIWFENCGHNASQAAAAAAKASADYTYTRGLGLAEVWFRDFIPQLRRIIKKGINSPKKPVRDAAKNLEQELEKVLDNPIYGSGWASRFDCEENKPEKTGSGKLFL